jgi:hypothetical protein
MPLSSFIRNVLQRKPVAELVKDFNWKILENWEDQQDFLTSVKPFEALDIPYMRLLFKKLIEMLEENSCEILDEFYSIPGLSDRDKTLVKKVYHLPNDQERSLCIIEDVAFISQGTTGLSTWTASLRLLEFFGNHLNLLESKKILELGSGAGLLGMALSCMGADKVILTDCLDIVLQRLDENIILNNLQTRCQTLFLDWTLCEEFDISDNLDLVIAADVVFDPSIIIPLVSCISLLKTPCLIASTERNSDTFRLFILALEKHAGLKWSRIDIEQYSNNDWFYYPEDSVVNLLLVEMYP